MDYVKTVLILANLSKPLPEEQPQTELSLIQLGIWNILQKNNRTNVLVLQLSSRLHLTRNEYESGDSQIPVQWKLLYAKSIEIIMHVF